MAHGKTAETALLEIEKVVKTSIQWLKEDNESIPEPLGSKNFKGHLTLRTSSEKHRELAIRSAEEGVSINQYVLSKL
jgi:predicted HicB family RNase H-like nuclease